MAGDRHLSTSEYREGLEQGRDGGRTEEAQALVLRLLDRHLGAIALATVAKIRTLPLEQVEQLGEALLDFSDRTDRLKKPYWILVIALI